MRRYVPLVAATLLSGCGAIPPAISLASYAIDGVSYLASGKTLTDHAISAAANQDCSLFRMVQNLEVCTDWGTQPHIAAARPIRSPIDRDEPSSWNEQTPGDLPLGPMPVIADRGEPMTLPAELADVAKAVPGVAKAETVPVVRAALIPPVPTAKPVVAAALAAPAKANMTGLLSTPAPVAAAKADLGTAVRSDDAMARRDAVRAAYEGRYLMVLGSFKGPEMASRLAKLYAGASVVRADVQGETYYRVVIEPEKGARLAAKASDKPWLMPAAQAQPVSLASTLR